jgi:hypothetical protein
MIALDELVPANHLYVNWKLRLILLSIYPLVKDMYSEVGCPSIDPIILIKMAFIQYIFGIRLCERPFEEIQTMRSLVC